MRWSEWPTDLRKQFPEWRRTALALGPDGTQFPRPLGSCSILPAERTGRRVDRIWLKAYPAGVPAEIDADSLSSIPDLLSKIVAKFSGRPVHHNFGHTLEPRRAGATGTISPRFLQGLPAMGNGGRVAIMSPRREARSAET